MARTTGSPAPSQESIDTDSIPESQFVPITLSKSSNSSTFARFRAFCKRYLINAQSLPTRLINILPNSNKVSPAFYLIAIKYQVLLSVRFSTDKNYEERSGSINLYLNDSLQSCRHITQFISAHLHQKWQNNSIF